MPTGITISLNEQTWIKHYLQEKYDVTIVDSFDCKTLSNLIFKEKGTRISYSTFRRLFDLVTNTHALSRFILNSLAYAVGFKNWDTFKNHVVSFDNQIINQNIQIYSGRFTNSSKLILETVKNLPINTWTGAYQLQIIVKIAIENKDFKLLEKIVSIPFDIENQTVYEQLVISFQSFYFQSINGNNDVINFVERNINQSKVLQKCLLQAYVDESQLNGFLGLWFEAVKDNLLPDILLFKNLLMCQKAFTVENDPLKTKRILYIVNKQLSHIEFEIHPILKARIGVWELIINKNSEKLNAYFKELDNPFEIADFAVITSRLLWMYQSKNESILFLDNIKYDDFPLVKNYFQKGRYNVLLLTLAINYYLKSDIQNAKITFKLVDKNVLAYDIVNINFYVHWIEQLSSI